MNNNRKTKPVLITGGAGYIGSKLAGRLLFEGYSVILVDNFLHGGDSILSYLDHPNFKWINTDISEINSLEKTLENVFAVVHLAGISGFPACQALGRELTWKYNVTAPTTLYSLSQKSGVDLFIFPSTYTAYGIPDSSKPADETSPPNIKTLFAESKVAAEKQLLSIASSSCQLVILRLADVYGISPRTRFDILVNQFVWQAISRLEITIYQKGYWRSFIHIDDAIRAFLLIIENHSENIGGEIFNVGSNREHYTKQEVAQMIAEEIPGTRIAIKDITFGGYRSDVKADFSKIEKRLGYRVIKTLRDGIKELKNAILNDIIHEPGADFHHNARFPIL